MAVPRVVVVYWCNEEVHLLLERGTESRVMPSIYRPTLMIFRRGAADLKRANLSCSTVQSHAEFKLKVEFFDALGY